MKGNRYAKKRPQQEDPGPARAERRAGAGPLLRLKPRVLRVACPRTLAPPCGLGRAMPVDRHQRPGRRSQPHPQPFPANLLARATLT